MYLVQLFNHIEQKYWRLFHDYVSEIAVVSALIAPKLPIIHKFRFGFMDFLSNLEYFTEIYRVPERALTRSATKLANSELPTEVYSDEIDNHELNKH